MARSRAWMAGNRLELPPSGVRRVPRNSEEAPYRGAGCISESRIAGQDGKVLRDGGRPMGQRVQADRMVPAATAGRLAQRAQEPGVGREDLSPRWLDRLYEPG